MTMNEERPETTRDTDAATPRIFLVVVDDTEEWRAALRYACRRVLHTNGKVALLHVIDQPEIQQWLAVEEVMREERRQEAEARLQRVAKEVNQLTGTIPILHVREGSARDELLKLIEEEPSISILVLGVAVSADGPGPLIQFLTAGRGLQKLRIPVTLVPGQLTPDEIDRIA